MRIAFAGTPEFAATALQSLIDANHEVVLVLTQPDRPCGRGMKLKASPVKQIAQKHGIPVITPQTLSVKKDPENAELALSQLESSGADVLIVAAYGLILPERALYAPRGIGAKKAFKALNIHASLLPRWRGAAPIQRAIEAGDASTGISIMKMEKGLDTGPVLLTKEIPILDTDTASTLTEKLMHIGASSIVEALDSISFLTPKPQDESKATYAKKILKEEALIDWSLPSLALERRCRAFFPFPGLRTALHGESFKIWAARSVEGTGTPGETLCSQKELIIACGNGALQCLRLQKANKPIMDAPAFLQSFPLMPGDILQ